MTKVKRLLEAIKPIHYDVDIELNEKDNTFIGTTSIRFILNSDSDKIYLHSNRLDITSVVFNGEKVSYSLNGSDDELEISLSSKAKSGEHHLFIEYQSKISDNLHGLYRSTYKGKNIYVTQLESHHARDVFPCIDEPAAKATFSLGVTSNDHSAILGNTPIEKQTKESGRVKTEFEKTPIMSTYLLAIVIGDLESLSQKTKRGVEINTWATPDKVDQTRFALETAVSSLELFEEYFALDFPLPKCDLVALPDFAAGAMENWGLITYRETAMLVDDNSGRKGQMRVTNVVAHELAHQWFGNLVTMEWWTDLWLNEGFATWIEHFAADKLHPDWNMWTEFFQTETIVGQSLDSLSNSHPIEVNITDPNEIRSIFDAISYSKGASVIQMLNIYLGEEKFRDGLRYYLEKHQYENASTKDLWNDLEEFTQKPVSEFMDTWTEQVGFPVVKIDSDSISQKHFLINTSLEKDETIWTIPLLNGTTKILDARLHSEKDISIPLNQGRSGFFYTNYSKSDIQKLSKMDDVKLPIIDKAGLLHESFALSQAGQQSIENTIVLIDSFSSSESAYVWGEISAAIADIRRIFPEFKEQLQKRIAPAVTAKLKQYGVAASSSDDHNTTLLRPIIASLGSFVDDRKVIEFAEEEFKKEFSSINSDLQTVVFRTMVKNGDSSVVDKLIKAHDSTDSAMMKVKTVAAICSTKDKKIFQKNLNLINSNSVRHQDVYYWIAYAAMNPLNFRIALDWIDTNWDWLHDTFSEDIATLAYFPNLLVTNLKTNEDIDWFDDFFKRKNPVGIGMQIAQAKETIQWHALWRDKELDNFSKII